MFRIAIYIAYLTFSTVAVAMNVVVGEGSPSELQVLVDDQFSVRQNKIGYYGKVEEGRICIDDRALIGLAV